MHRSIKTILDRRTVLTGAVATPLAMSTPSPASGAPEDDPYSFQAVAQRVDDFARLFDVSPIAVTADEGGKAILSDDLIDWCSTHGASVDWIASGNNRSMLQAHRTAVQPQTTPTDPVKPLLEGWRAAADHVNALDLYKTSEADMNAACDAIWDWVYPLAETIPKTAAGLAAYLTFIREQFHKPEVGEWADDIDRKAIANAEAAALRLAGLEG